jgi:hypothetical protein
MQRDQEKFWEGQTIMAIGMSVAELTRELQSQLATLDMQQSQQLAQALAAVLERNNQEIDREIGRRLADIERKIGR